MITEDYVSFETAKLLKEKGFDIPCGQAYFNGSLVDYTMYGFCDGELLDCPSLSLALKWLREVHKIVIEINMEDYMTSENGELQVWYSYTIWTFIRHLGETGLTDARYDDRAFWQENVKVGQSYEQAVEAALLYVLKKLI